MEGSAAKIASVSASRVYGCASRPKATGDRIGIPENYQPLHAVRKLAHIPRPGVEQHRISEVRADCRNRVALIRVLADQKLSEWND